ncbi:MAG: DUF2911 domain-containing protein [bacterium]
MRTLLGSAIVAGCALSPVSASAQATSFVYRLGTDTVAIDQYTRTATRLSGEMVQRSGPAVFRVVYDMTIGPDGRPTAANITRLNGDGTAVANAPTTTRFRFTADSAVRENVFPDSVQRRGFAMGHAFVNFPTYVYGPTELLAALKQKGVAVDSLPALGIAGGPGMTGIVQGAADTMRLRGGAYAMVLRYDGRSQLLSADGLFTTNKAAATRGTTTFDLPAVARVMKPTGVLSVRDVARASFGPGGFVLVDYGRPLVRERTVWGGALVPFDSVWRAGANDATHLMTTRTLAMGGLTLAPGMYTLWIQHTRNGTFLIVNRQTGQWGTQYDARQDIGRLPMAVATAPSHVEMFTIAVRAVAADRGSLEMAWGESVASVPFTTSVAASR